MQMQVILILYRFFSNAGTAGGCLARSFPTAPRTSCVYALRQEKRARRRRTDLVASSFGRATSTTSRSSTGGHAPPAGRRNANSSGWTARPLSIISFARSAAPLICDIGERHRPGTNLQPGKPTRGAIQAPRGDPPLRGSTGDEFLGVDAGGIHAETVQRRFRRLDHRRRTAEIYFAIAGIQDLRTQ